MGGAKKKKKSVRLTRAQQEQADLDKAATTLKHSTEQFKFFVNRFDQWLIENHMMGIKIFQTFDTDHTGKVTYEQFKSGLRDLKIPSSNAELHLLCKLLDRDDQQLIEYNRMAKGLAFVRDREERVRVEDIRPPLRVQPKLSARCSTCALRGWNGESYVEKYPRFIDLTLRLVTFDACRSHPGHIQQVVHSHLTVFHLGCIVRQVTGTATTLVVVYADKSSSSVAAPSDAVSGPGLPLVENMSLEECGYMGGPQNCPTPLTLYYDFIVDVSGCPLLMCDHYFGQKKTGSGAALELRQRSTSRLQHQREHPLSVKTDVNGDSSDLIPGK